MKAKIKKGAAYLFMEPYLSKDTLIVNLAEKGLYDSYQYGAQSRTLIIVLTNGEIIELRLSAPCLISFESYDCKDQIIFNVKTQ